MMELQVEYKATEMSHCEFLELLLNGDHLSCSKYASKYLELNSIQDFYEKILRPSLYDIGELWAQNKISVFNEQVASAIVEMILNQLYNNISSTKKINKSAIVTCIEKESHQIGVKMVSDIFELNGWNVHFLGANIPNDELIKYIKIEKPNMLAISISLYFNLPILEDLLIEVNGKYPNLPIIIGGQAFRKGGLEILKQFNKVTYKNNLIDLEEYIRKISKND